MKAMAKAIRSDLLIATLALVISAGATLSSVYQTHVIARQLGASVWPYLSITSTLGPSTYRLAVTNDGLGPALVRSATLSVDGKSVASYREAAVRVARGAKLARADSSSTAAIGKTTVIRAGDTHDLIRASGSLITKGGDLGQRVTLALCYCSLEDQCWTVRSHEQRVAVASCLPNDGIDN